MDKKKIYFFRYDTWQEHYLYYPTMWYGFKRYYELNSKYSDKWDWIPPLIDCLHFNIDEIADHAINANADVYLFSSYMWSWDLVKILSFAIKKELPNAIVVLGGPHQHTTYTDPIFWFKDHPYVDATCVATEYGEFFIHDMLDQIYEGNLNWNNVRNSYHRKGKGPIGNKKDFIFPDGLIKANIDHAIELRDYANKNNRKLGLMYETNRGCMYKCTYCEWGGGTNTKLIIKEMEKVKEDISYFRDLEVYILWITDANFGILPRDVEISKLLGEYNDTIDFVGITGLAKTKPEKKKAVLEPLIESKLMSTYQMSLQTIDTVTLQNVERTDITPEENIELAKYLIKKYDFDVIVELILGLPGMTVETFYKETAIEYSLLNSVKYATHHVPLYILPDAPIGDPDYLKKFNIQLAPIGIEDSLVYIFKKPGEKYLPMFKKENFKKENTLHIPISSYSYTTDDWKEMFFMNDMNHVLMNMVLLTPFIDYIHHIRGVPADIIFKKIYLSISKVKDFYEPIETGYLDEIIKGGYSEKPWRQFEIGPIKSTWSLFRSYTWLWSEHREQIYKNIEIEFAEYLDDITLDCLLYCKNSTFGVKEDIVWVNQYRWDLLEESNIKNQKPKLESVKFKTIFSPKLWYKDDKELYRNLTTVRYDTNEPIKMKLFELVRKNKDD